MFAVFLQGRKEKKTLMIQQFQNISSRLLLNGDGDICNGGDNNGDGGDGCEKRAGVYVFW